VAQGSVLCSVMCVHCALPSEVSLIFVTSNFKRWSYGLCAAFLSITFESLLIHC
jgi:hypothetical protein